MIGTSTRGAYRDLEAKLRPFVARRVRSPSDVDDVVQDVFLRMQRGLDGLRDEERFGPWVYRVAKSAIVDYQRDRMRHPSSDHEAPEQASEAPSSEPGETDAASEVALYVAPFIAMLASPYREALTLTELSGVTQREAATMVGISVSGMKSRVQRGRRELRALLEACCLIALDARGHIVACEPRPEGLLPDGCCSPKLAQTIADRRSSG